MTPKKFSLIPGNISRFFILMVIVLLATMGVMIQSAVNAWLKEKSYQVVDVSHALHQRIDAWRYATWQIYDNIAATSVNTASGGLQETRLKQDVYYLEKPRRKTEALIFGSHDSSTLEMTQKMSDYLDILWGAETIPWSMYYLNGLDNSLILVSTLPLKDLSSSFKESTISSVRSRGARKCCCRLIPLMSARRSRRCAISPGRTRTILRYAPPSTSPDTLPRWSPSICRLTI